MERSDPQGRPRQTPPPSPSPPQAPPPAARPPGHPGTLSLGDARPEPGAQAAAQPGPTAGPQASQPGPGSQPPAPLPRRQGIAPGGPGSPEVERRAEPGPSQAPGPGERRGLAGPGLAGPGLAAPNLPGAGPAPTPEAGPAAPAAAGPDAPPTQAAPPAAGPLASPGLAAPTPPAPAQPGPGTTGAGTGAPAAGPDLGRPVLDAGAAGDAAAPSGAANPFSEGASVELTETTFSRLQRLSASNPEPRQLVEAWLSAMVRTNASDLILRAGGRPSTRIDGRIGFLPGRVPGPGPLMQVLKQLLGSERMEQWKAEGSADSALHLDGLGRFRLNAYKQMGEPALVIRRIRDEAPVLEDLELPGDQLTRLAMRKRGLFLVTGVAGSGKSTTLSALIQHMNTSAERHVITLEDPVELLFTEKRCVISQREVGTDCTDFQDGLRHALRQSPDVILIGEMRDAETVTAALDASETGHLVLSTMHTVNAAQTLDRILGFYRAERHRQVRMRLGDNLAGVLSQRLVPKASGKGLVPACELMTSNPRIRELLEEGHTMEIARVIEQGGDPGLISFNQSLRRLVQAKLVELKDALSASDRPDELVLALRGITQGRDHEASKGQGKGASSGGQGQGQGQGQRRRPPGPPPRDGGSGGGRGGLSLGS